MTLLITLPILIPLFSAIAGLLAWRSPALRIGSAMAGGVLLLAASLALLFNVSAHGVAAVRVGDWPAPFGIILVADLLGAMMVTVSAVIGLASLVYSWAMLDPDHEAFGYYPLVHVLLMGVCGAFLTGDIFNLYVWFEVMLISSFVLMALGGGRGQLEGSIKYVTLNFLSSAIFLAAVGILYGTAGTLNMADLSVKLSEAPTGFITVVSMLFLAAFGIKAGVFPLFFWLPASYHTPPPAVSALFAGLLTKVGVYALIRTFTLIFNQDTPFTAGLTLWIAGLTMVTGVLGAAAQFQFRRILSFHIISQIGYMVMGLGLLTPLALAGSVFYVIHHIIVKTNLFLIGGVAERLHGIPNIKGMGGLYHSRPVLAVLFLIPAFSLAGIPPLSGFWAKYLLIKASLETHHYWIAATALVVGLLTLYSMAKIWDHAFWKPKPEDGGEPAAPPPTGEIARMMIPVIALALITCWIGLYPAALFDLSERAAEQLLNPEAYINAVLGAQ